MLEFICQSEHYLYQIGLAALASSSQVAGLSGYPLYLSPAPQLILLCRWAGGHVALHHSGYPDETVLSVVPCSPVLRFHLEPGYLHSRAPLLPVTFPLGLIFAETAFVLLNRRSQRRPAYLTSGGIQILWCTGTVQVHFYR